jgi:type IV secretory pathway VirB4 component
MPGGVADSLAARLERYVEGSLSAGLFAGPTNVSLDRSFVVFQVRDLAEELRPLAIHLIAGWVWTRVRRDRRPRLLFVDEAWSLLRFAEGGAFLASMARRARKHYLGLVTITQQVSDLADGGHGGSILANAAQILLLKQRAETIDAATVRFRLTPDERQLLLGADKGEGLLLLWGQSDPYPDRCQQDRIPPCHHQPARPGATGPRDYRHRAHEAHDDTTQRAGGT